MKDLEDRRTVNQHRYRAKKKEETGLPVWAQIRSEMTPEEVLVQNPKDRIIKLDNS